ncbi:MAG: hypothetical protein U1F52_03145 [Burkholderiales bacterium]
MLPYDPETFPDATAWLAADERTRSAAVAEYHRLQRIPLPKRARPLHAMIHAVVETQLAQADLPIVRETLDRLLSEGLSRHDAIHAIGSVLASTMMQIVRTAEDGATDDGRSAFHAKLNALSAAGWKTPGA